MTDRAKAAPTRGGSNPLEDARERALDSLTSKFASGSITLEEYEKRAGLIQQADSPSEVRLHASEASLAEAPYAEAPASHRQEEAIVERRSGSPEFSLCVMGDRRLSGDWLNSDQATSLTLMGSTTLDLRDTALPPGRLKIDALAIMGEIKVIVPRGVPVKMSAFPFMGEARVSREVQQRIVDRDLPWVDVSGMALMGSIIVKSE